MKTWKCSECKCNQVEIPFYRKCYPDTESYLCHSCSYQALKSGRVDIRMISDLDFINWYEQE